MSTLEWSPTTEEDIASLVRLGTACLERDGGLPDLTLPCLGGGPDVDLAGLNGPVLAPGLGAQGGSPEDLRRLFDAGTVVVPASHALDDVDEEEEEVEVGSGSWVVDRVVVGSGTGVCVVVIGAGAVVLSVCGR